MGVALSDTQNSIKEYLVELNGELLLGARLPPERIRSGVNFVVADNCLGAVNKLKNKMKIKDEDIESITCKFWTEYKTEEEYKSYKEYIQVGKVEHEG